MVDSESARESILVTLLGPDFLEVEVGCDDNLLGAYLTHLAELIFGWERFVLANLLEEAEHECLVLFDVVDEDNILVSVPVPELGLVLVVETFIGVNDILGLPDTGLPVDPLVVQLLEVIWLLGAVAIEVNVALELHVVHYLYVAFLDTAFRSDLECALIERFLFPGLVESGRGNSVLDWPVDSGIFLATVVVCCAWVAGDHDVAPGKLLLHGEEV